MKAGPAAYGDSLLLYVVASKEFGTLPVVSGFNDLIVISVCPE